VVAFLLIVPASMATAADPITIGSPLSTAYL
jgi:hypothetical protein